MVMFFLLRLAFWLCVVCILLPSSNKTTPTDAQIDASEAMTLATAAVSDVRGFCERQPDACVTGGKVAVALESERRVREAGAVPATIGVLDGQIRVGLTAEELERFDAGARKVGGRDLAACAVQGAVGATTVGGTLAVCRAAGIRFMGTGGLGGVHRGFPHPPDVSSDLAELARTPALVVSAGIKSLLDVAATAEVLETLGVPLLGFQTDELPLFYAARGGPSLPARVESANEAAEVARAHWKLGGAGILLARPPDESLTASSL